MYQDTLKSRMSNEACGLKPLSVIGRRGPLVIEATPRG